MNKKSTNDRLKLFIRTFLYFIFFLFILLFTIIVVYLYVNENIYNFITAIIIILLGFFILLSGYAMYLAIMLHKRHKTGKITATMLKKFSKIIMVLSLQISELIKIDKDEIRGFFVEINNIIVKQQKIKCSKDKILLLIPHCLQNSECGYKITNNPYNCKRCGKCCVNDILKIVEEYNIKVCVASGGTMARKAVTETNPDVVIAVACSRDLMSGILDINDIPVIAIENYRPEGPCINTKVDIEKIKKALKEILD